MELKKRSEVVFGFVGEQEDDAGSKEFFFTVVDLYWSEPFRQPCSLISEGKKVTLRRSAALGA